MALIKTLKEFILGESDAPTNTVGSSAVAQPDSEPLFKRSKYQGEECLEVDTETYNVLARGKKPFERWSKYIKDEEVRNMARKLYQRNKSVLVKNAKTGSVATMK